VQQRDWPFGELKRNHYRFCMIDPPWNFRTYSEAGMGKSAENHYETMSLIDIAALPVRDLAHEDGAWLWLWTTSPFLEAAFSVIKDWGFRFSTEMVWRKMTKNGKQGFGTGYVVRGSHEPILICRVGKPDPVMSRNIRSCFDGLVREHSRKPEEAYEIAKKLFPGPRVDLFSRQQRNGFDAWGHEVTKFNPANDNAQIEAAA
jgi:N6-adenosine-specific RNA methylase IME4